MYKNEINIIFYNDNLITYLSVIAYFNKLLELLFPTYHLYLL